MGLVDIHDSVLQGISDIAYEKSMPVEDLIENVIIDYTQFWENDKTNAQSAQHQSIQSRKYKRQKTDWNDNFHFQFTEGASKKKIPGKLKDISINGLSFAFDDQQYAQEDLSFFSKALTVSFENPEDRQTIQFRMKPRHIRREGNEKIVGLAFSDDICDYHDFVSFLHLVDQQARLAQQAKA